MKIESPSDDKNLNEKSGCEDTAEYEKDGLKRIFCPACNRYVSLDFIVAGICKDCFDND